MVVGGQVVASLEWERECGGDVSMEWIEKNERQCNEWRLCWNATT